MRVKIGIPGIDELVQGGLPEGSCVVLEGPSGNEKECFASSYISEGISKGDSILVVLSSKPPAMFFEELKAKGFDPEKLFAEGRLRVVDWYSQKEESVVEVEEEGLVIKVSLDLLNVGIAITRAISSLAKDKPKRAVVEILSPALSVYDLSQVHTFAQATKAKLSRQNITSLFLIEKEMHDSTTLSTLVQPFDGVIDMDRAREGDKIVRKLAILSLKGTAAQSKYLPFEITDDGRLELGKSKEPEAAAKGPKPTGERTRDAGLWFSLGKALLQSGRHEKALVALESCVKVDPGNAEALTLMAEALEKLGRREDAERARLSAAAAKTTTQEQPKVVQKAVGRPSRIFRILETSEDRLAKNPKDADAHFARATALAALERYDDSMKSLNELTKIDHRYPGLWLLKAKIYTSLGDGQKAKLCRDRAEQIDAEVAAEEAATRTQQNRLACPLCNAIVREGSTVCPSCGIPFETPEGEARPPKPEPFIRPPERPEPEPEISKVTTPPPPSRISKESVPGASKGRTNGLTNGMRGRTNGLTNGIRGRTNGLTNGSKGRTNGLTNGMRGRTNGLTNGVRGRTNGLTNGTRGHTNGLTNGLRGRTNGLTNGLRGRTNGLTNGLRGRTNGLTNGMRGRTNGLTNGAAQGTGRVNGLMTSGAGGGVTNGFVNGLMSLRSGITNGLTNGNGFTNGLGAGKFIRQAKVYRWKLYMVPLVAVLLLMLPVLFPSSIMMSSPYSIVIDGDFSDWTGKRVIAMQTDQGVSANARINRAGVVDDLDYLSFYVEVEGSMLQGGPDPPRLMDAVRIFIDADNDLSSGYLVKGMGADWMIEVWGWRGVPQVAKLWRYPLNSGQHNWSSWLVSMGVYAGVSGSRLETEVPWMALEMARGTPVAARFQVRIWDGQEQFSEHVLSNGPGLLQISERSLATATLSGNGVSLLVVELTSLEGSFSVSDLRVQLVGTAPLSAISSIRLLDSSMSTLDSRVPTSRQITFHPAQPIDVNDGAIVTMTIAADITASDGTTLGVRLARNNVVTMTTGTNRPSAITRLNYTSAYPLGYVGFVPMTKVIDGGFEDWTTAENDPIGEPSTLGSDSVDIVSFDSSFTGGPYFYLKLNGGTMAGTVSPQPSMAAPDQIQPTVADSDRDSVPDGEDPNPFDFNNDGTPDANTNHDADADAVTDYPWGFDYWLNTTIPGGFPAPYAGRVIDIYIGPSTRPVVKGEDSVRFYVDVDNSTLTGYSVMGIGADYMIELRGREGMVLMAGVYRHNSPNENQWLWASTGAAVYALEHERIEVTGAIPGVNSESKAAYETSDWRAAAKDDAISATRGTRGLIADGVPVGLTGGVETYLDETGQIRIAELEFSPVSGEFAFAAEKNGIAAYFGKQSEGGSFSLLSRGDLQFSWKPIELGAINDGTFIESRDALAVTGSVKGNQVEYRGLFPMVNDRYSVALNTIKHDVVFLSESSIPNGGDSLAVRGSVSLSNGTVFMVDGRVVDRDFVTSKDVQVVSRDGVLLTLRAPFAYEEGNKEARIEGSFRVEKSGSSWLLSMEAPLGWFLSESRTYPVILDPTGIVDTSTSSSPTVYHNQRKIFHDGTYFWMFYYDGSNTQYEYSADGMSWVNTRVQAFTTVAVQYTSVWYHDTGSTKIVYMAGDISGSGKDVYVRRGTISGTTITWGTEAKPVVSSSTLGAKAPFIMRASNSYIWLSAINQTGSGAYSLVVMRTTTTDTVSSWYMIPTNMFTSIATTYIGGSLVPLSGGDIYAVWYADGSIAGKKYTWGSSTWGSAESIATTSTTSLTLAPSAISDSSGYVHLVYIASNGNAMYNQRTTSWGSATTLDSSSGNLYATISQETSSGKLYAFWRQSTNQIAAKEYSSSTWSSISIETSTISKSWLTSIYNVSGESKISWAWTDAPFTTRDVRFSMKSTTTVSVTVDTSTSSTATTYSHQRKIIYDGTYYWAFVDDGTTTYYTYSATGATWMNGYTQLFTTATIQHTSVWYYSSGSTKIVYAVGDDDTSDTEVVVKRGSISGTSISWGSDYLVDMSTKNHVQHIPFISRDASGYIWIGASGQETNFNFNAIRSVNTDDVSTWGSFTPLMAADSVTDYNYGAIVPLASGDVYALWYSAGTIYGRKYTASNTTWWTSIKTINTTTASVYTKGPSVVVDSNYYVNLVFSDSTGRIIYRQMTTSWGTATVVATTTSNVYPSITLMSSDYYVFWIDSTYQITGKKYSSSSWSSISPIDTSTIAKNYLTTIYSVSSESTVCWVWGQGGGSGAYETKFSVIPEFQDVAVITVGIGLFLPVLGRVRKERRRTASN